jgi:four helix bundle protein
MTQPGDGERGHWRIGGFTNLRIYEFTNLRIYEFENTVDCVILRTSSCRRSSETSYVPSTPSQFQKEFDGTRSATYLGMNPRAEELKRRTFEFALRIIRFCRILRRTWEGCELSDQLFRSGTRVGANYRAACRARSHPDFIVKIGHVVEEADESIYWLEVIRSGGIVVHPDLEPLIMEANELSAIFNQSQLTAKSNAKARHRK